MAKKLSTKQLIKQEEKALKKREKLKKKGIEPKKANSDDLDDVLSGNKDETGDADISVEPTDDGEAPDLTGGAKRRNKIAIEKEQEKLKRNQYLEETEQVEAVVPISFQRKFLYYTTTIRSLERIKKILTTALTFFVIATIAFAALYMYEREETYRTYKHMSERAIKDTIDTIAGFEKNPIDTQKFSRMITGEVNTVRMASEQLGVAEKYTNKLNDVYYLMVNCPEQMKKKYADMKKLYQLLLKNIEDPKAYQMIDTIYKSIDLKGK